MSADNNVGRPNNILCAICHAKQTVMNALCVARYTKGIELLNLINWVCKTVMRANLMTNEIVCINNAPSDVTFA